MLRCSSGAYHSWRTRCVEPFGERLGEPVGDRLHRDRRVVVVRGLVPRRELVGAVDRDGERADRVVGRRDVVGEAAVRTAVAVIGLLAQEAEAGAVDDDVVPFGMRGPEAVDAARAQRRPLQDLAQERLRVVVDLACRRVVEDRRELALQIPGVEEELPVDVRDEVGERRGRPARTPANGGAGRSSKRTDTRFARARRERQKRPLELLRMLVAEPLLQHAVLVVELAPPLRVEQARRRRRRRGSRRGRARSRCRTRARSSPRCAAARWSPRRSGAATRAAVAPSRARRRPSWSSDGVISPERPTSAAPSASAVSRIRSGGTMTPRSITS